ncbi:MAG: RNA polymerase sigma factor [Bacteroidales bacterium]|nr:RNA polymerase sigma factor [Bacteroidales bacterium]
MTIEEYNSAVDQYSDNIYRFVLKNLKDEDTAKDIIQDTFEKLWMKRENVSFQKVKSYLFTTAYHTLIDFIRKQSKVSVWEDINEEKFIYGHQYNDVQEVLNKAINYLPDIQRSVLLLRDYEGYSYQEITEITGLNESQVKVYIYRARVFLKNYIGKIEILV